MIKPGIYIRRAKKTDKADSLMTAYSFALASMIGSAEFVVIRRYNNSVIAWGKTRSDAKKRFSDSRPWKEIVAFFTFRPKKKKGKKI